RYVKALPAPPASIDWTDGVAGLRLPLGNMVLGDCTSAAAGHALDAMNVFAKNGAPQITRPEAIAFYSDSCGYIPGDPATDNGGTLQQVLAYWKAHGYLGGGKSTIA